MLGMKFYLTDHEKNIAVVTWNTQKVHRNYVRLFLKYKKQFFQKIFLKYEETFQNLSSDMGIQASVSHHDGCR